MNEYAWTCVRICSGVATYETLGYVPLSSFGNSVYSAVAASLTVKILTITKEKRVVHFRISAQKQAKTVVEQNRNPWQERSGNIYVVPPSLHFLATPLCTCNLI